MTNELLIAKSMGQFEKYHERMPAIYLSEDLISLLTSTQALEGTIPLTLICGHR